MSQRRGSTVVRIERGVGGGGGGGKWVDQAGRRKGEKPPVLIGWGLSNVDVLPGEITVFELPGSTHLKPCIDFAYKNEFKRKLRKRLACEGA